MLTNSEILKQARAYNAGRGPGKVALDPAIARSPSVRTAIEGMIRDRGATREEAEDALMRAHNLGEILNAEELAARLKVPVGWISEKTRSRCKNPIPCKPMGRYVVFDWDEVVKWLEGLSNIGRPTRRVTRAESKSAGPVSAIKTIKRKQRV
jgi:hypothetical protein